jgi:hypothetical protein
VVLDRNLPHPHSEWYARAVATLTSPPNDTLARLRIDVTEDDDYPLQGWGAGPDLVDPLPPYNGRGPDPVVLRVLSTVLCPGLKLPSCPSSLRLGLDVECFPEDPADPNGYKMADLRFELFCLVMLPSFKPDHLHFSERARRGWWGAYAAEPFADFALDLLDRSADTLARLETLTLVWRSRRRALTAVPALRSCARLTGLRVRANGCPGDAVDPHLTYRLAEAPRLRRLCLDDGGSGALRLIGGWTDDDSVLESLEELEWMAYGGGEGEENAWDPGSLLWRTPALRRLDLRVCTAGAADAVALGRLLCEGAVARVTELDVWMNNAAAAAGSPPVGDDVILGLSGCPDLERATVAFWAPSGRERTDVCDLLRVGFCPKLRSVCLAEPAAADASAAADPVPQLRTYAAAELTTTTTTDVTLLLTTGVTITAADPMYCD